MWLKVLLLKGKTSENNVQHISRVVIICLEYICLQLFIQSMECSTYTVYVYTSKSHN